MTRPGRPLQNRVDPFGALVATAARGTLMGNRGGRFHLPGKLPGTRRWASRQWIACVCAFKGRHRAVWGDGYTEVFFLDEVTALAAGHRPCFECRRTDALAFRSAFVAGTTRPLPRVAEMDAVLHAQRGAAGGRAAEPVRLANLPDGTMISRAGNALALLHQHLLPWSDAGYGVPVAAKPEDLVTALTPAAIIRCLQSGYSPRWHASVGQYFGETLSSS